MSYKTVSFNIGTAVAGTNVDVETVGFPCRAVVLVANGRTGSVDANGAATYQQSIGFANSSTSRRYVARMSENGVLSSNVMGGDGSDACIAAISTGGAYVGKADFVSSLPLGFRLVIDQQFTPNLRVTAHCFDEATFTQAETGIFTERATPGNLNVPTSFEFDHLFMVGEASGAAQPSLNVNGRICFGFCDATFNQAVWMGGSLDGQATSSTGGYCRMGEVAAHRTNSTTLSINSRLAITAKSATNFSVNNIQVVGTAARQYMFLILKGGRSIVGSLLTEDDTITPMVESGFGWTPAGAMFVSGSEPEDAADTPHTKDEMSLGGFDAASDLCHSQRDDNEEATTEVSTGIDFNDCYMNLDNAGALDATMRKQTIDSGGFTTIMSNAENPGFSAFTPYMAFEEVSTDIGARYMQLGSNFGISTFGQGAGRIN